MLKSYLAKLPVEVLNKTVVTEKRIVIPIKIDSKGFYKENNTSIEQESFTDEKAIFIASKYIPVKMITVTDLLNRKVRY